MKNKLHVDGNHPQPSNTGQPPASHTVRLCGLALITIVLAAYVCFRVERLNDFMVHVDDFVPLAESIRLRTNPFALQDTVYLSSRYTYPPGQFILSLPLASLATDFHKALALYRFPSLLIWLIGLGCFYRLLRISLPAASPLELAVPLLLGLLSWRGFLESSQGYSYACTTLVAVVFIFFSTTTSGTNWIRSRPRNAIGAGLIMGCLPWLTYQALFMSVIAFGTIGIVALARRDWRLLGFGVLSGVTFSLPTILVIWICLRPVLTFASGVPSWAASNLPASGLPAKLIFPFTAWFDVLQNNLTFLPWGSGSRTIAILSACVLVVGMGRMIKTRTMLSTHCPLLIFIGLTIVFFSLGAYLHLFPLGATRHSFILQIPLLCALALALSALQPFKHLLIVALGLIISCGYLTFPSLLSDTNNRVDYDLIKHHFERWPDTRIADLPGGFTWEITYLAREDPARLERIRWFLQFQKNEELAAFLMQSDHALMVSHRGPMSTDMRNALVDAGGKMITTLAESSPRRGTELSGQLNGGNGFFLYLIER